MMRWNVGCDAPTGMRNAWCVSVRRHPALSTFADFTDNLSQLIDNHRRAASAAELGIESTGAASCPLVCRPAYDPAIGIYRWSRLLFKPISIKGDDALSHDMNRVALACVRCYRKPGPLRVDA